MEELLINNNQDINITEKELVEQTKASVKVFSDVMVKSKAYYNLLASEAVEAFLRDKGLLQGEYVSLHSSMKLLGDFEVADIQLANVSIDVRAVFDENELFIPKKHFEYKLLPDIYLFVKLDDDLQNATILGFVKPSSVNLKNQNDEYYFVNNSILSPVSELVSYIKSMPEKNQYVISENVEETLDKLIMLFMDNDIDDVKLEKLFDYLKNSVVAREKLVEFENFECLLSMAIQEFKDLDVENNSLSKYIKTLVTSDEFAQFGIENDFNENQEVEETLGLFIDEDVSLETEEQEEDFEEQNVLDNKASDDENDEDDEDDEDDEVILDKAEPKIVDEFEVFETFDEFDMTEAEIVSDNELVEGNAEDVVSENESEENLNVYDSDLLGEDLELQVEELNGVELDLAQNEADVVSENSFEENVEALEMSDIDDVVIEDVEPVTSDLDEELVVQDEFSVEEVLDLEVEDVLHDELIEEVLVDDVSVLELDNEETLDIDMSLVEENEVSDVIESDENIEEIQEVDVDMSGVVTDDIPFAEEGFEDIADIIETSQEDNASIGNFEMPIEDDFVEQVAPQELAQGDFEVLGNEDFTEDTPVEEMDNTIENMKFIEDEESVFEETEEESSAIGETDFSLEELLEMGEQFDSDSDSVNAVSDDVEQTEASDMEFVDEFENDTSLEGMEPASHEEENYEVSNEEILSEQSKQEDRFAATFAIGNKQDSQKNILLSVVALITVIGLAGAGAWSLLAGNKTSVKNVDIPDNSGVNDAALDINDVVPPESSLNTDIPIVDNINSKEEVTKTVSGAQLDVAQDKQTVKDKIKPLPEQITMQKIKKDFSQPNTYLSVSKIVWDVPEYLTYNDDFAAYLQSLGSSVKLNLSSDLLLITEDTLFNKVRVKIQLKDSGRKFSAELIDSCGSKVVDNLVLQSVKSTLNIMQPPVNSLDTVDEDLFLTIYL